MNISIGHTVCITEGNFGNLEYKFAEVAANFIGKTVRIGRDQIE